MPGVGPYWLYSVLTSYAWASSEDLEGTGEEVAVPFFPSAPPTPDTISVYQVHTVPINSSFMKHLHRIRGKIRPTLRWHGFNIIKEGWERVNIVLKGQRVGGFSPKLSY